MYFGNHFASAGVSASVKLGVMAAGVGGRRQNL